MHEMRGMRSRLRRGPILNKRVDPSATAKSDNPSPTRLKFPDRYSSAEHVNRFNV